MKVALVAIAKEEGRYIDEWVDYHVRIGFDSVFVYANDWRIGRFIPNVTEIPFDGPAKQMAAYTDWLSKNCDDFDWAAFFDVDEFLNTHGVNIKTILEQRDAYPAIAVNWRIFGDAGLTEDDGSSSVLSRFTKSAANLNQHVKTIINLKRYPRPIMFKSNPHIPECGVLDQDGRVSNCAITAPVDKPYMELNHYFCKTRSEFLNTKMKRGRSDCIDDGKPDHAWRTEKNFDDMNINEVDNTEVFDIYMRSLA